MAVSYGTGPKGKATRLHAELVRSRGRCHATGFGFSLPPCAGALQCAHIIPRTYSATRTDERNAFCLCAAHHFRFGAHPDEWMAFVDATIGRTEYNRLKAKALAGGGPRKPWEWEAEAARLKALLEGGSVKPYLWLLALTVAVCLFVALLAERVIDTTDLITTTEAEQ